MNKKLLKKVLVITGAIACVGVSAVAFASGAASASASGNLGSVAANLTGQFGSLAKLITGGSYVAGMGFAVSSIAKFKAHKDNPTQIPIGTPIALLFVAAALIFVPSVFKTSGSTLFGGNATVGGPSGAATFGATIAK